MSITSQESDGGDDDSVSITEEEWKQLESDLQHISLLQQDALERMERLSVSLTLSLTTEGRLMSIIQQCHDQSLQQLSHTNTVTFGQLLLQHLSA